MCKGVPESDSHPTQWVRGWVGRKLTQSWPHLGSGPACLSWAKLKSSYQLTSFQGHLSPTWATSTSLHEFQVHAKLLQSCPTLCDHMDWSPPGSSAHGILQARILEWVAMPSSRGSSQPRDRTHTSHVYLHWQAGSLPLAPPGKPAIYIPGDPQLRGAWEEEQTLCHFSSILLLSVRHFVLFNALVKVLNVVTDHPEPALKFCIRFLGSELGKLISAPLVIYFLPHSMT